jgi:hypothetical protein
MFTFHLHANVGKIPLFLLLFIFFVYNTNTMLHKLVLLSNDDKIRRHILNVVLLLHM